MNLNTSNDCFINDRNLSSFVRLGIKCCMPLLDLYWYILLVVARLGRKKRQYKYEFSICAIFYNEELSLKEWLEYHLVIGVDHFYLYNHESTDNYKEILKPYIENGIVTMIDWPIPSPALMSAIEHLNSNYKMESHWVAYIDLDEYICPHEIYNIKDWIKAYKDYPSVVAYWKPYGSSGLINHDYDRLITEQYTVAWNRYYDLGKTFFNNDFEIYKYDKKYLHVMNGAVRLLGKKFSIPPINEFKYFVQYHCNRIGLFRDKYDFTIRVNHYVTKSYQQYFKAKLIKGDAEYASKDAVYRNNSAKYAYTFFQAYSTMQDFTIYRYMIQLKTRMDESIENHLKEIQ